MTLALFGIALLTSNHASAQTDLTGVSLGVYGGMTSWDLDDFPPFEFEKETGVTFGGSFGWGMSDFLGLFTRADYTSLSTTDNERYNVTHWDIGFRAIPDFFGQTVRPYFEFSGAFRFTTVEKFGIEITASGAGVGLGTGLYVFVSNTIALNAGFAGTLGNLEDVKIAGIRNDSIDLKAVSGRLLGGITVFL